MKRIKHLNMILKSLEDEGFMIKKIKMVVRPEYSKVTVITFKNKKNYLMNFTKKSENVLLTGISVLNKTGFLFGF